jgi:hypothetical protein
MRLGRECPDDFALDVVALDVDALDVVALDVDALVAIALDGSRLTGHERHENPRPRRVHRCAAPQST